MLLILSIVAGVVLMAMYSIMALNTYKRLVNYRKEIVELDQMQYANWWAKSRIKILEENISASKLRLSAYCFLAVVAFVPTIYIFMFV